jgi:putative transposase
MDGAQARLGVWRRESAGAQCWLSVWTARHNRGVQDGLSACVDGLQGLPEAMAAVLPKPQGQVCLVPQVRNRLQYVPWKARRAVAADRRAI